MYVAGGSFADRQSASTSVPLPKCASLIQVCGSDGSNTGLERTKAAGTQGSIRLLNALRRPETCYSAPFGSSMMSRANFGSVPSSSLELAASASRRSGLMY